MLYKSLANTQVMIAVCGATPTAVLNQPAVTKHVASNGVTTYTISFELSPGLPRNAYLVLSNPITLIYPGATWQDAQDALAHAFTGLREHFGEPVALYDVQRLILTHDRADLFPPAFVTPEALTTHLNDLINRHQLTPTTSELPTHPATIYEPA